MVARVKQSGLMLIEVMFAVVIGAIILAALNSLVKLGLDAYTSGRGTNEITYQGTFALQRMATKASSLAPKLLSTTPAANTSGDWLAPTMYCLKSGNLLIETTTADSTCTGTTVIANNVTSFTVQAPSNTGAVDDPTLNLTLSMTDPTSKNTVTLALSTRLGGGTQ